MSAGYQTCLGCGKHLDDCNDCPAGTSDHLDKDLLHKAITDVMRNYHLEVKQEASTPDLYDSDFGDERECKCGHMYYRHFDWAADYATVGCKYSLTCECPGFELRGQNE